MQALPGHDGLWSPVSGEWAVSSRPPYSPFDGSLCSRSFEAVFSFMMSRVEKAALCADALTRARVLCMVVSVACIRSIIALIVVGADNSYSPTICSSAIPVASTLSFHRYRDTLA